MSTAAALAWLFGVLFAVATFLLAVVVGSVNDLTREVNELSAALDETRAHAALRLIEAERASLYPRCPDTGDHGQPCSLPVGHPGGHWAFHAGRLVAEWSE